MSVEREITDLLMSQGANLVGIGDLTNLPSDVRHGLPVGIAIAVALDAEVVSSIGDGPTKEYRAEYRRLNSLLGKLSRSAAQFLQDRGSRALSFAATGEGVNSTTHSTRLPHKTVATHAGLGWIGKCALLVTKPFGSAIRLNKVLTDANLETAAPEVASRCGDCAACVTSCPGHAAMGKDWAVAVHRDEFFDIFACRKAARKLAMERIGIEESICGICIAACPWTQAYIKRSSQQVGER